MQKGVGSGGERSVCRSLLRISQFLVEVIATTNRVLLKKNTYEIEIETNRKERVATSSDFVSHGSEKVKWKLLRENNKIAVSWKVPTSNKEFREQGIDIIQKLLFFLNFEKCYLEKRIPRRIKWS